MTYPLGLVGLNKKNQLSEWSTLHFRNALRFLNHSNALCWVPKMLESSKVTKCKIAQLHTAYKRVHVRLFQGLFFLSLCSESKFKMVLRYCSAVYSSFLSICWDKKIPPWKGPPALPIRKSATCDQGARVNSCWEQVLAHPSWLRAYRASTFGK